MKEEFDYHFYNSIAQIEEGILDSLSYGHILSKEYFLALEQSSPFNMEFSYCLVRKNFEPVAFIAFQIISYHVKGMGKWIEFGMKNLGIYNSKKPLKVIICGNALISGNYSFNHNDEINDSEFAKCIAEASKRLKNKLNNIDFIILKDFFENDKLTIQALLEKKYHSFKVDPCMTIKIPEKWQSFDDYFDAISSKYKKRCRKILHKLEGIEVKELSNDEMITRKDEIERLYKNVNSKVEFQLTSANINYLPSLKEQFQEGFVFKAYFLNGEMVGFLSSLIANGTLEAHLIGLDYEKNKDHEIYQNILYDYLKQAIDFKCHKLNLGRTALEIKSNLGADEEEAIILIRHTNRLINWLITPLFLFIERKPWVKRYPFKEGLD